MKDRLKLKRIIAPIVLRGPVLKWWIQRKALKLDNCFVVNALKEAGRAQLQEVSPKPASVKKRPIQSLLFICDNMWEDYYLLPELKKICAVEFLNLRDVLKGVPSLLWASKVENRIRAFITENRSLQPDLILFYARPTLLSEESFASLRQRWSCPIFGMNLDDKLEFLDYRLLSQQPGNYQQWAKFFDLNLTNTVVTMDWYRNRQLPVYYMPQGFRARSEFPFPEHLQFDYQLSFVGSRKPERQAFVEELRQFGLNLKLFGYGWPNSQPVKQPETVFRSSMMNLGLGLASPSETLTTTKGRDFECPGSGACYITTYNWELAAHYDIGKEILCYRNVQELVEMYAFYTRRPEICLKIAQAAYLRCQNEHTWEKRFRRLFQETGFV